MHNGEHYNTWGCPVPIKEVGDAQLGVQVKEYDPGLLE
jgi:hypothetical protein